MDVTQEQPDMSDRWCVYTRKRKKLQEQSQEQPNIQKLQGQSALISSSNRRGTRFLISQLPLFVTEGQLIGTFETYGSFVHRPDRNYTLSCVVEIVLDDDAAGARLLQTGHKIDMLLVTVELYTGNEHHVFETGKHELEIHNVRVRGSYNTNGEMIYSFLEALFHQYSYSEMELRKISEHKYTG